MIDLIVDYKTPSGAEMHGAFKACTDMKGYALQALLNKLQREGLTPTMVCWVPGDRSFKELETIMTDAPSFLCAEAVPVWVNVGVMKCYEAETEKA